MIADRKDDDANAMIQAVRPPLILVCLLAVIMQHKSKQQSAK